MHVHGDDTAVLSHIWPNQIKIGTRMRSSHMLCMEMRSALTGMGICGSACSAMLSLLAQLTCDACKGHAQAST